VKSETPTPSQTQAEKVDEIETASKVYLNKNNLGFIWRHAPFYF
jgi:hypothetical protein